MYMYAWENRLFEVIFPTPLTFSFCKVIKAHFLSCDRVMSSMELPNRATSSAHSEGEMRSVVELSEGSNKVRPV